MKRPQLRAHASLPLSVGTSALSSARKQQQGRAGRFSSLWSPVGLVLCCACSVVSFYAGASIGYHAGAASAGVRRPPGNDAVSPEEPGAPVYDAGELEWLRKTNKEHTHQKEKLERRIKTVERDLMRCHKANRDGDKDKDKDKDEDEPTNDGGNNPGPFHSGDFSEAHTGQFASGMHLVDREDFAGAFDTGVPLDPSGFGNDRVLLLYSDPSAFPSGGEKTSKSPVVSARDATANCNNLHIVYTQTGRKKQCVALMGQYESYHLHRFMRVDKTEKRGAVDPSLPLVQVSRGYQQNGRKSHKVPTVENSETHWDNLVAYLQSLRGKDNFLEATLDPILKKVASHNDHNTVVVMVCNFGQSELLWNFVCNARAKGFGDVLNNILLFATDKETHELATEYMGITSIYIESIFGDMPRGAARAYADRTFRQMMAAKVYCVQMVSVLGYDLLFQDVDIVWYQNPLEWFHDTNNPHYHFDMYFQDDGNHSLFYAPYSANTGFYYVRNNPRTQFFFNSLLMAGDLILSTSSHQIALIALLNEHVSLYGLTVKIWERNKREFPGGFLYHNRKAAGFMKELMAFGDNHNDRDEPAGDNNDNNISNSNENKTYIFHMSWTKNKNDKVKFFQQMGEWYLDGSCKSTEPKDLAKKHKPKISDENNNNNNGCCLAMPKIQCHYRDKPSKIPCNDSPTIDKKGKPFW